VQPNQPVSYLHELDQDQGFELWKSVRDISQVLTIHFQATSMTIEVKNGVNGSRLSINVIPRKPNDLAVNDMIYDYLEGKLSLDPPSEDLEKLADKLRDELN
jgi:diadenosine tetraphosphate (Ap4A) HIT family hydrolase